MPQRFMMLILALAVPVAFAQTGCSNADPTGRDKSGAQHENGNGNGNDASMPAEDASQQEPEQGEGEEEGEAPTADAAGVVDTGRGAVDTGGAVADTGAADTGGVAEDTGTAPVDTGVAPPAPETRVVDVQSNFFSPSTVTIRVGDTVMWEFEASGHTVTSGDSCVSDGMFDSGLRNAGTTFSRTFTAPGSYDYHCIPHCGEGMTGVVIVEP